MYFPELQFSKFVKIGLEMKLKEDKSNIVNFLLLDYEGLYYMYLLLNTVYMYIVYTSSTEPLLSILYRSVVF